MKLKYMAQTLELKLTVNSTEAKVLRGKFKLTMTTTNSKRI